MTINPERRLSLVPEPIPRELELERLAEALHASIEDRHNLTNHHPGRRDECSDPICSSLTALQRAAAL